MKIFESEHVTVEVGNVGVRGCLDSICIKEFGDAVFLTRDEAREIARAILRATQKELQITYLDRGILDHADSLNDARIEETRQIGKKLCDEMKQE